MIGTRVANKDVIAGFSTVENVIAGEAPQVVDGLLVAMNDVIVIGAGNILDIDIGISLGPAGIDAGVDEGYRHAARGKLVTQGVHALPAVNEIDTGATD